MQDILGFAFVLPVKRLNLHSALYCRRWKKIYSVLGGVAEFFERFYWFLISYDLLEDRRIDDLSVRDFSVVSNINGTRSVALFFIEEHLEFIKIPN